VYILRPEQIYKVYRETAFMDRTELMYTPSKKILRNYADVLINFALNSGKGIKQGEVVYIMTQQPGLPLAKELYTAVLARGAYPLINIIDDDFKLLHVELSSRKQLLFFPAKYYRGLADTIDQWVRILCDKDPAYMKSCDPKKVLMSNLAARPFRDWLDKKEDNGKFTWTLCIYGTEGMAKEAGLSLNEYWDQIAKACFLNDRDPKARWRSVNGQMQRIHTRLTGLAIDRLHVKAKDTDLWITVGKKRKWLGGRGRNIPSFEIFTSPDWRGTEGKIFFDLPLYRYGNIIKDISLEFRNGRIVKARAAKNEKMLHELIAQKNADKIGEFSLTDRRFSKITRFMADTLFDENYGGPYGNTHLAVGKSYHDTYNGDMSKMKDSDYERLGYNHSVEHTDIIASTDRTVTAVLANGTKRIIYENGQFVI
jgi:aminopeptidase